jgi:hypothetical protein
MNLIRLVILLTASVIISCEKQNPRPLSLMQQREAILSNKKMEKIKTVFNNLHVTSFIDGCIDFHLMSDKTALGKDSLSCSLKSYGHRWSLSLNGNAFAISKFQDYDPIEGEIVSLTDKELVLEKRLINGDVYVHTYQLK